MYIMTNTKDLQKAKGNMN